MVLVTPRKASEAVRSARKTDRTSAYSVERPSVLSVSSLSRPSLAPGRAAPIVKDRRPTGDNAFQTKCVREIISFLREHEYPGTLEEKTLRAGPTRKDFYHVMEFLHALARQVHLLEISCDFEATEDGVVRIFKQLRYPFMTTPTFLRSINAPGTWPTVLSALHWFVHIVAAAHDVDCTILYKHKTGEEEDRPSICPGATPARGAREKEPAPLAIGREIFHQYVVQTYGEFLEGTDEDQTYPAANQDLQALVDEMVVDVEAAAKIDSDVLGKGEHSEVQVKKYRNFLASQDAHLAELTDAVAAMRAGVARQEQENAALDAELAELTSQVSGQEWTLEAVQKLRSEKLGLERASESLRKEHARFAAEIRASGERADTAAQALTRAVRELQGRVAAVPSGDAPKSLRGLRDVELVLRSNADEAEAARDAARERAAAAKEE